MMEDSLEEIKNLRKSIGLTQIELSRLSGVSQSLIAKVESKKIDPTFSKTKKIFEALNRVKHKNSFKAKDVFNRNIISVKSEQGIREVIKEMKRHGISQIPVIDKNVKGMVSESSILDQIQQGKDIKKLKAKDVMDGIPPILSEDTDISLITNILKYNPLIILSKNGVLTGVITKVDILRKIYK